MPWYVAVEGDKFCVHKGLKGQDEGKVPGGCHNTREEANSHMRALYRNVKDATGIVGDGGVETYIPKKSGVVLPLKDILADANSNGMMVAVYLPSDLASELAFDGGLAAEDLHVTLGYMGNTAEDGLPDESIVKSVAESLATVSASHPPLTGRIGGLGRFPEGDEGRPVWVPVDVVGLDALRVDVIRALQSAGLPARTDHGFAPHITLAYETDSPHELEPIEPRDVTFSSLYLKIGEETLEFPLSRQEAEVDPIQAAADDIAAQSSTRYGIRLYFQEGEQTTDRRVIDPNAINFNRPPPLPVRLQLQSGQGGHDNAVVAGVINKTFREGLTIVSEGPLESGSVGQEVVRLAQEGILQTWSPDLGDETVDLEEMETGDELVHFVQASLLGATIVAMPALSSAVFEIYDYETGKIIVPAPTRSDLAAAAGLLAPPAAFFTNPELTELQRWTTITDDGRVYGHSAGKDECHIGYLDRCVTIDMVADCNGTANFEVANSIGHVITAEGTKIGTSPLPIKGGHAPKGQSWYQALSHYDNPEATVADIVHGMDEFGVWFSGAIRPTATEEQLYVLRASGVSMDCRQKEGLLRYLLTCCVNTPGFNKTQARLAASGDREELSILSLVAAGGRPLPDPTLRPCNCDHIDLDDRIDYLEALISAAGIEDLAMERLTASFESST